MAAKRPLFVGVVVGCSLNIHLAQVVYILILDPVVTTGSKKVQMKKKHLGVTEGRYWPN